MFKTLDLYAGGGGLALGAELAGFQHVRLIDNNPNAVATLQHNRPEWYVEEIDARIAEYDEGEADVIYSGFPCPSFSHAGNRGGLYDESGLLYFEFVRALQKIKPIGFISENVVGLTTDNKGNTLKEVTETLIFQGYDIQISILNANHFDVAQNRQRVIIVGTSDGVEFNFPIPNNAGPTLRDALKNVPNSAGVSYSENKKAVMELIPSGGNWRDLPEDVLREYAGERFVTGKLQGGNTGLAKRLSWDEPSPTLTTSPMQKRTDRCHPEETRPLTIREYARIQSFPDDWSFKGSIREQYKQIGNAVPPNMSKAVSIAFMNALEGKTQHIPCKSLVCTICDNFRWDRNQSQITNTAKV